MPKPPINKPRSLLLLREGGSNQPTLLPEAGSEAARASNVPEVTVSELSNALKRTVEDRFGFVRLRGEVSNYRGPHASGHAYFCLKDEGARIDAVVWKTTMARMRVKPEEGMEVVATGKITTFPGKSSYQIVVETLEPAGLGALMALLEERRRKLAAEGLFDAVRKRALPFLPLVIGVITSPTGAVIRDILHRVKARFPRHIVVWPVRVQGDSSSAEVAAAIRGFNALLDGDGPARPHLLIVARGGGSLEDLWGYNDEAVVRAVAESLIPLISAVGHETDWTLIDHVADLRAPTPTGAAEMALPVLTDLFAQVVQLRGRQSNAALRRLDRAQSELRAVTRLMPSSTALLAAPRQRVDRAATQLPREARLRLDRARLGVARLGARLGAQSPQARMARDRQRLLAITARLVRVGRLEAERRAGHVEIVGRRLEAAYAGRLRLLRVEQQHRRATLARVGERLTRASRAALVQERTRVAALAQMLTSLSYRSVLDRGFAVVRGRDGAALRTAASIREARHFDLDLADGRVPGLVAADTASEPTRGVTRPEPGRKRQRQGVEAGSPQGFLFGD